MSRARREAGSGVEIKTATYHQSRVVVRRGRVHNIGRETEEGADWNWPRERDAVQREEGYMSSCK